MLAVAAALIVPRLLLLGVPFPLDYNEGWHLYRAALVQSGDRIYGGPPDLWITNYPPVSYHVAAMLARLTGDLSLTGRLMSMAGLVVTAICAGSIAALVSGVRAPGLYAATLLPVWLALYAPDYIAMNDPQLFAMGIVTFGVYAYLRAGGAGWLIVSAVAFALGLFTKHNLLDLPFAVALHLLVARRWHDLAVWVGAGMAAAVVLLGWSHAADGPYVFDHLLIGRAYLPSKGLQMTGGFVWQCLGAVLVTIIWGRRQGLDSPRGFLLLALAVCFTVAALLAPGIGVDRNIFFNTLVALAMATAVALHDLLTRPSMGAGGSRAAVRVAILMLLPLLPGLSGLPRRAYAAVEVLRDAPRQSAGFAAGVRLLQQTRQPALCENLQLCFAAGEPLDYEPFALDDWIRRGYEETDKVVSMIEAHRWGAIVIVVRPGRELIPDAARQNFSLPIIKAIFASYAPALATEWFVILLPKQAGAIRF